jgi:hypothetical protein
MTQKPAVSLSLGVMLLVMSLGLVWFGFSTNDPNPAPALSALAGAVLSFIVGVVFISKGTRSIPTVESSSLLRKSGNLVFVVGAAITAYAAVAVFVRQDLPPNNGAGRLPSLYLLFGGMAILFVGTVIRNFRLR